MSLDEAWKAAEAAMPDGAYLVLRGRTMGPRRSVDNLPTRGYRAACHREGRDIGPDPGWWDTPEAALRALAEAIVHELVQSGS